MPGRAPTTAAGAADRSYGVHVAELAGLPADGVSRAWAILRRLESEGNVPLQGAESRPPRQDAGQLALFAPFEAEHPVVDILRGLDVESMTPLEALVQLYELRQQAAKPEHGDRS